MTIDETKAEMKRRLDEAQVVENKYPDPNSMPNEEMQHLTVLWDEYGKLESDLSGLETKAARLERLQQGLQRVDRRPTEIVPRSIPGPTGMQVADNDEKRRFSPGQQFVGSTEYKAHQISGVFNSPLNRVEFAVPLKDGTSLLEWKALLRGGSNTSGQSFVLEDHQPGYVDILQREINVLDLVPRLPTSGDTIEYVSEDTYTNAAAFVAEATGFNATALGDQGVKPQSTLAYSTKTSTIKTMAHWIPVTNRMLADAPAIRGIIDGRLLLGLTLVLETQIVSGNGAGENLTGITATNGINVVGKGATESNLDALFRARNLVRITGNGRPSAILMHPTDFGLIRLARESASTATPGSYLMGPPSQMGATTLWGMPVVESAALTAGTAIVADWAQAMTLFDREQGNVRVGTINDQFIRNIQTILAELRAAFVVWRPTCVTQVTGLA